MTMFFYNDLGLPKRVFFFILMNELVITMVLYRETGKYEAAA